MTKRVIEKMPEYFSHDHFSRSDPKLVSVRMRLGLDAVAIYWFVVEMLHEQGGYLELAYIENISYLYNYDADKIKKLISDFGLFKDDGENFFSESVLLRIQKRKDISKKAAKAGRISQKKQKEKRLADLNGRSTDVQQASSEGSTKKGKEKKEKESKVKEIISLPHGEAFRIVWEEDWLPYRKAIKAKMPDTTVKKQLAFLAKLSESEAVATINQTIEKGWKGLFEVSKGQRIQQAPDERSRGKVA